MIGTQLIERLQMKGKKSERLYVMVSSGRRRLLAICRYAVATTDMSLKRKERCEQILSKDKSISKLAAGAKGKKTEQLDCRHKTDKVTKINEHAAEPETFL